MKTKLSVIFWELLLFGCMYENGTMTWIRTLPALWNNEKYFSFVLGIIITISCFCLLAVFFGIIGVVVMYIINILINDFKKIKNRKL